MRDRDDSGRPNNARPRDSLGRPLEMGAAGVPRIPDGLVLPPEETLREAQRLLDEGLPFHAHEVLEAAWKVAEDHDRGLWKGLAQLAVGITHHARGNPVGAARLLRRGAGLLVEAPHPSHPVDAAGLSHWAVSAAAQLEDGDGLPPVPPLSPGR